VHGPLYVWGNDYDADGHGVLGQPRAAGHAGTLHGRVRADLGHGAHPRPRTRHETIHRKPNGLLDWQRGIGVVCGGSDVNGKEKLKKEKGKKNRRGGPVGTEPARFVATL
jgi:hypothetical protein